MKSTFKALPAALLAVMVTSAPVVSAEDSGVPTQAQPGANFVRSVKNTGSYGSGETTISMTRMAPRTWNGQEVQVWQQANGPTLLMNPSSAFVALVAGDKPLVTFDPPSSYNWPLKVGKTWTTKYTITDHAKQQAIPVEISYTVEAYEDVTVPAGTFKGYRIKSTDNQGNDDLRWFSTELGIWLKEKLVRTEKNPNGPGARESEMLSQTIRK